MIRLHLCASWIVMSLGFIAIISGLAGAVSAAMFVGGGLWFCASQLINETMERINEN